MKKVFVLILVIFTLSTSLKAVDYDYVSARDAHAIIVNGEPNLYEDYELIEVGALNQIGYEYKIDFETGNAQLWYFIFKPKNTDNDSSYLYSVFSIDGNYSYNLEIEQNLFVKSAKVVTNTWRNSTDFANEYLKSSFLTDYYNVIKDDEIINIRYTLLTDYYDNKLWDVNISPIKYPEEFISCSYEATSLQPLGCHSIAFSGVDDKLSRATMLFPQPSKDYLNIELPFSGDVKLELYNTNGIVLKSMNLNTNGDVQFNTSDLPTGVYNLVIKGSNSTFSKKVIVTK